jgi:hypothetical protein
MYNYHAFHLNISSELYFPELLEQRHSLEQEIDIRITFGEVNPSGLNHTCSKTLFYQANEQQCYHKIHDAYTFLNDKTPMIPHEGCLGALYFIRNPLDVAISFANHSHCSIDEAITAMGNKTYAFCKGKFRQHNQLRQWLLSWSLHVQSWVNTNNINTLVLRYEDMKQKPMETFSKAVQFLQLDASEESITNAIENSHIDKLQALEEQFGFNEKPTKVGRFFRKGIVGDWQNTLSTSQIAQIIHDHGDTMRIHGYLDEHNQPII